MIFTFKCKVCDWTFSIEREWAERFSTKCPHCHIAIFCAKEGKGPAVHTFKETEFRHISEKPIRLTSKKALRKECEKHDLYNHVWE